MPSRHASLFLIALLAGASPAFSAEPNDNSRLTFLYRQDQAERAAPKVDWPQVTLHDIDRNEEMRRILKVGGIRTASDYFHAGVLAQHGTSVDSYQLAYALSKIGLLIAPDDLHMKHLNADAWDRVLVQLHRPQWYGTQFVNSDGSGTQLAPMDRDVMTESARTQAGGLSDKEIEEQLAQYRLQDAQLAASAAQASSQADVAFNFGGSVKLENNRDTMMALARQDPALGLFWFDLADRGVDDIIGTGQVRRVVFQTQDMAAATEVFDGKKAIHGNFGGYGTFIDFSMAREQDGKLLLDLRVDDKVLPQAALQFNFYKHYRITADYPGPGQPARFVSLATEAN